MSKLYYRIAHEATHQGLWYDSKGNFTGYIHDRFNFCMNTDLPMPFDPDLVGWLSATDSLDDLFNWFSKDDIKQLEEHGWFITIYEADNVKQYRNHLVICQETSIVKEIILISSL
jgi:hypothetical protein